MEYKMVKCPTCGQEKTARILRINRADRERLKVLYKETKSAGFWMLMYFIIGMAIVTTLAILFLPSVNVFSLRSLADFLYPGLSERDMYALFMVVLICFMFALFMAVNIHHLIKRKRLEQREKRILADYGIGENEEIGFDYVIEEGEEITGHPF